MTGAQSAVCQAQCAAECWEGRRELWPGTWKSLSGRVPRWPVKSAGFGGVQRVEETEARLSRACPASVCSGRGFSSEEVLDESEWESWMELSSTRVAVRAGYRPVVSVLAGSHDFPWETHMYLCSGGRLHLENTQVHM